MKSTKQATAYACIALGALMLMSNHSWAQYADTLWVQVTFYDYHADFSNPNFEPAAFRDWHAGVTRGMVQNVLDGDRKPTLNPPAKVFNHRLTEWFRPSGIEGTGAEFTVTNDYSSRWSNLKNYQGEADEWVGQNFDPDDSMATVVIYDSLPFELTNATTGTYQFDDQNFFPLDGRGFGAEPAEYPSYGFCNVPDSCECNGSPDNECENHNYSFAMEIHREFTYEEGLVFEFTGDDDVWCFINNGLQMDIGGIHGASTDSIDVGSLGLTPGNTYSFDFFYCERHVNGSHIRITTNIVSRTPPSDVRVSAQPSGTIWEGDTVRLSVQAWDQDDSLRTDWAEGAEWEVFGGSEENEGLSDTAGANVFFVGSVGDETYRIAGTVCNPRAQNLCRTDEVEIVVRKPHAIRLDVAGQPPRTTLPAGQEYTITAQVFDDREAGGRRRTDWEALTEWTTVGNEASLSTTTGASTVLTATYAYDTVRVIGTFTEPNNTSNRLRDTVVLYIEPGPPSQLVIENDSIIRETEFQDANPVSVVFMDSSTNEDTVCAVVRDQWGNYVRLANATGTQWQSLSTAIATVSPLASNRAYFGHIVRVADGTTEGVAREDGLQPDTVDISITSGTVLAIRFVNEQGEAVPAVNMTTDDSLKLSLQVRLSTAPDRWVSGTGRWELTPAAMTYDGPPPPQPGAEWTYRPKTPGNGQLCATSGEANTCIDVSILPGVPNLVEMRLLTPDSLRVAGETLLVEVRIENLDGLVPGTYCFGPDTTPQALYADPVDAGAGRPAPIVVNDWGQAELNQYLSSGANGITQCFDGGIDTVKFVLYNAPRGEPTHILQVKLEGSAGALIGQTDPFVLKPGPLARLELTTDVDGLMPVDSIELAGDTLQPVFAHGFDAWGNWRDLTTSEWETTGSLDSPTSSSTATVWLDAGNVTGASQSGDLIATAPRTSISDRVYVFMRARQPHLVDGPLTRDRDGDGYIDALELRFNREVDLSSVDMATLLATFGVTYEHGSEVLSWQPTGLQGAGGTMSDSVFILSLEELENGLPQTGWLPIITTSGIEDVFEASTLVCADGAGPVVWKVIKIIDETNDASKYTYKVAFSEPVEGTAEGLNLFTDPQELFTVWERHIVDGDTTYTRRTDALSGGSGLFEISDTLLGGMDVSMLEFQLPEGELFPSDFLTIKTEPEPLVRDTVVPNANLPADDNRKTPVEVLGRLGFNPRPVPNPSGPDAGLVQAGDFTAQYQPGAVTYVENGGGGFATVFEVLVPDSSCSQVIRAYRKIYDMVGNLVVSSYEPDLLQSVRERSGDAGRVRAGTTLGIEMYWNGFNSKGLPAAPGVYREIMYVDYECSSLEAKRAVITYGVGVR